MRTHTTIRRIALGTFLAASATALEARAQSVDNNGGFNYSVPIKVPAGTAGMGPSISLDYNSMGANGLVGIGWSLSAVSVITRDPSYRINFDLTDHYLYQGEPLLHEGNGRYHTKDESFLRIQAYVPDQTTSYWTVTDRNGIIKTYGNIAAVGKGGKALLWALTKVQDPLGNYYTIDYYVSATDGDFYPTKIVYTRNDGSGKSFGAYRAVWFTYLQRKDHSPKYVPTLMDTDHILTWITVKVGTDSAGAGGSLLRKYRLEYGSDSPGPSRLTKITEYGSDGNTPPSGFFSSPSFYSPTGATLPPLSFTYQNTRASTLTTFGLGASILSVSADPDAATVDLSRLQYGDFNGDGRTDIYAIRGGTSGGTATDQIYLSAGSGLAAPINGITHSVETSIEGLSADIGRYRFADFNGDGRTDVYYVAGKGGTATDKLYLAGVNGVMPATPINGITHSVGQFLLPKLVPTLVPSKADIARVQVGDFNGDGRADIYFVDGRDTSAAVDKIHAFNGDGFATPYSGITHAMSNQEGTLLQVDLARFKFGDFDGDGRTDVYYIQPSTTATTTDRIYSSRTGAFGSYFNGIVHWSSPDPALLAPELQRFLFGDFNGDGRADVYYVQDLICRLYLSDGYGSYVNRPGTPHTVGSDVLLDLSRVFVADFDRDGRADVYIKQGRGGGPATDLLWRYREDTAAWNSSNAFTHTVANDISTATADLARLRFADFTGDGRPDILFTSNTGTSCSFYPHAAPDVLTKIQTGAGGNIGIYYLPATMVPGAVDTTLSVYPKVTNFSSRSLVTTLTADDGMGTTKGTKYEYFDGRYLNGPVPDRRNLGFSWMRITDLSTGMIAQNYFLQDVPYAGLESASASLDSQGHVFVYTQTFYDVTTYPWGGSFVSKAEHDTTNYNGPNGDDAPTQYCVRYRNYDSYGNATVINNDGDLSDPGDDTEENLIFAINDTSHLVKIARSRMFARDMDDEWALATERRSYFDGSTTLGSIGQGLTTRVDLENGGVDTIATFEYDGWGNATKSNNPRVNAGEYSGYSGQTTYDSTYHMLLATTTNALGHQTSYTFNSRMLLTSVVDPNANTTIYRYDVFGNQNSTIRSIDSTSFPSTAITVDPTDTTAPIGKRTQVREVSGQGGTLDTYTYYDGLGRVIQTKTETETAGTWSVTDYYYDSAGRQYQRSLPYASTTPIDLNTTTRDVTKPMVVTTFDGGGRPSRLLNTDTSYKDIVYYQRWTYVYDEAGMVTSSTLHAEGGESSTLYTRGGLTYSNTYTLTRVGATLITDDVGLSTFLTFDLLGRKTSQNDPDMGYWTWTYDANGNVLSQTDAKNQTLTYAYDRLNRRIATNYPNGTATLFYYDGDDNRDGTIDPGRSGMKGRLTAIKAPDATEILTYDALGRLTRKDVTIAPENTTKSESFAYDAMDRVVGVAYPDNEVVTNSFNTGGRLETVSGKIGSTTTNYVTGIDYDPLGGVTRMALGNGQTINYDYYDTPSEIDPGTGLTMSFRLKKVSTTDTSLLNLTYTYDRRGNVLSKTDGAVSANSETYWYDDFNRVVLSASASAGVRTYFYDSSGNITMKDNIAYLYGDESHAHAVTSKGSSGYSYDANGNMVNRNGASLTYDYENRLVESGAFPAQRYAYLGERRVRAANNMDQSSDVTWYPFGNYEEQGHETGGSHTPTQVASRKYYYANGVRVAQRTAASGVQYILSDRLGSAAVVTSANGTLVGRQAYAPFGTQLGAASIPTAYTFTGKERDGANGLYYYGARFYDSDLGRFVTPDTMIPTGTPQTRNRYAYADNNPVRYTDPSGHAVIPTILNLALSGPNLWGFRPNDVIHVGVGVMADALGVKSISFGFYAGVGGEVSYNFRDNTMSGAFGVGGGAHANISTTRMDYGGACGSWVAIGYDQQGNTVFLTAQAQAQFGPVGVGAGGRLGYSFDSGEAEFSANAGGGVFGASVGASYSSRGGVTFSAGVGVPGLEGAGVGVQYNAKNGGWRGSVSLSMCFVKGTLVDTKSGGKPIEQIQAGDEVLAMDESTGTMGYKKVVRTFVNHTHAIAKVKVGGVEIESTPGHRFWVVGDDGGRWITAESLQPGMQLVSFAGTPVSVDAVSVEKRSEEVYNFEVEEWHTYVAGGVVVHNECTDKDKDENGELVGPLACFETAGTSQPAPKSSWDAGAFALYGVETESLGTFGEAALIVDFDGSTELISGGGKEVGVPYVGNAKAGALVTPHGTTIYTFELHAGAWSVGSFSEQSGNHMQAGYYVTGGNMAFAGYGAYLGFPWPF